MTTHFFDSLKILIDNPRRVLVLAVFCAFSSLLFKGTFLRLWTLHRDMGRIQSEILLNQKELEQINLQLKQAKDPSFIERQARDKLDYANENDLVFVFAEE